MKTPTTLVIEILSILFTITSVHLVWFHSSFPAHLFGILKTLGWKKNSQQFWTVGGGETKYADEWFTWVNCTLPPLLAELLTCPVCLSVHISTWVSLIGFLVFGLSGSSVVICLSGGILLSNLVDAKLNGGK